MIWWDIIDIIDMTGWELKGRDFRYMNGDLLGDIEPTWTNYTRKLYPVKQEKWSLNQPFGDIMGI